jgi:hypothetical protein
MKCGDKFIAFRKTSRNRIGLSRPSDENEESDSHFKIRDAACCNGNAGRNYSLCDAEGKSLLSTVDKKGEESEE